MLATPFTASIATLAALPVALAAASGATAGGTTMLGAGLVGLAGMTVLSERWRRRVERGRGGSTRRRTTVGTPAE